MSLFATQTPLHFASMCMNIWCDTYAATCTDLSAMCISYTPIMWLWRGVKKATDPHTSHVDTQQTRGLKSTHSRGDRQPVTAASVGGGGVTFGSLCGLFDDLITGT